MKNLIAISAAALSTAAASASVNLTTSTASWTSAATYYATTTLITDTLQYATQTSGNLVTSTSSGNGYHSWADWTATSPAPGTQLTLSAAGTSGAFMTANDNQSSIKITFTNNTGNAQTGVMGAGVAFSFDSSGVPATGDITVSFANGLSSSLTQVNLSSGFVGVWNENPISGNWYKIASITISVSGSNPGVLSVGSVYVGLVPAPGAVALVGVAGLVGSRRRRA
jgi:hypothetical protein